MKEFLHLAEKFETKLKPIKAILLDVDGILTDGTVYYQDHTIGFNRFFNVTDGYILKVMMNAGFHLGLISGGNSEGLRQRIENLKIKDAYLGNEDKRAAYLDFLSKYNLEDHEVFYMGDEFFDAPLLKRAGFSATVPSASLEIQNLVDYVTTRSSGKGAVREVLDILRYVHRVTPEVLDFDQTPIIFSKD